MTKKGKHVFLDHNTKFLFAGIHDPLHATGPI